MDKPASMAPQTFVFVTGSLRAHQKGVSLFIALVALVLMTVAGFSLLRSVDTGNVIAGNMAFRETTVHASDIGVEAAAAYIDATVFPSPAANIPAGCTVASVESSTRGTCRYSARALPDDDNGIPYVDWTNTVNIPETAVNGITYQYVIDRLCNPDSGVSITLSTPPKYAEAVNLCVTNVIDEGKSQTGGNAYSGGGPSKIAAVHYRVTVRVRGPRNTVAFVQTLMAR